MSLDRVVVINDLSQAKGGATGLALLSARALGQADLDVTYVCGDAGHEDATGDAQVVAAGSAGLLQRGRVSALTSGIYNSATRDMLRDVIARTDTPGTVYHVHGWAQILSPSIFDALAPVAARTLIHAHDMFLACPNGVYMDYPHNEVCDRVPLSAACLLTHCDKRSRLHKTWRVFRQRALRRALRQDLPWGGIIPIHPDMIPRLMRAGYEHELFHVIRNPAAPFSTTRIEAENNTRFAYVGRLERDKGALDFARAVTRVGVPAVLVGDGVLRAEIERDFPHIPITGWQDRDAIGTHLQDARALVMPSRHPEPFALVLPEAILSGLPVAVAETALMAREIAEGGFGQSFNLFDPNSFDAALCTLRDMSPEQTEEMSRRGHAAVGQLAHSTHSWADALIERYRELV
ncbi:MAG: glycosyltransferase family 4 protein [Paracoccaceae bacterium]